MGKAGIRINELTFRAEGSSYRSHGCPSMESNMWVGSLKYVLWFTHLRKDVKLKADTLKTVVCSVQRLLQNMGGGVSLQEGYGLIFLPCLTISLDQYIFNV